jgi:hypothetical protein
MSQHVDMEKSQTILITDCHNPERLVLAPNGARNRWMARLLASSLDSQLASGLAPESSPLLAARAVAIVSVRMRRELARNWQDLLIRARGETQFTRTRRIPLCRDRIIGAEHEIEAMLEALDAPLPLPARGIAMANLLITDGTGPLYNRASPIELETALLRVTRHLDPTVSLAQSA